MMNMKNQPENISIFEAFIQRVIDAESAVGLAVSVINADGTVLYEKCFGARDQKQGLPMTADTLVGIASISKSFTALAVMQLYERGVIDIEKPVRDYVPGFARSDVLVRHLLSHIGGFYPLPRLSVAQVVAELGLSDTVDPYLDVRVAERGLEQLLASMNGQTVFTGRSGENFSYSNDSFALLSELVRLYGGEPTFAQYVEKHILAPLGMHSSGVRLLWQGNQISKLYQRRGEQMADDWTMQDDQSPHAGAGGVKSTLNDMKKYALMYLNHGKSPSGERVLSEYGIREMLRPRVRCELNGYYGYGLRCKAVGAMTVWGHGGDQPGVAAHLDWSEESGIAVVVLCNTAQVTASAIAEMAIRLASGYSAEASSEGLEPIEWNDELMESVCGRYLSGEGTTVDVSRDGAQFKVVIDGSETIAYPINRYMLRVRGLIEDMLVSVYHDADGQVYALGGGYRMIPKIKSGD